MNKDILFNRLLSLMPNFLSPLKPLFIKTMVKGHGKNFHISPYSVILTCSSFECGDDVFITRNFYCSAFKGVSIGHRVMISPDCTISGGDHSYNQPDENMRFPKRLGRNNKIVIEDDVWIGHGAVLLKNAFIKEGAIIGANSLVDCKVKPYSIYMGYPATFLKPRFKKLVDLESYLLFMRNNYAFESKYTIDELKKIYE